MFCSLASRGRCCGEFLNNGRAEFCEMWNSRLDSASFGILSAAARFCLGLFSFPFGFVLFFMDMTYLCLKEGQLQVEYLIDLHGICFRATAYLNEPCKAFGRVREY